jgi:hypothetical protein
MKRVLKANVEVYLDADFAESLQRNAKDPAELLRFQEVFMGRILRAVGEDNDRIEKVIVKNIYADDDYGSKQQYKQH